MKINVIDEEEIERQLTSPEPKIYIVQRVVDTDPDGGSLNLRARRNRTPCETCREICWMDPRGYEEVAILSPQIICTHCMIKRIQDEQAASESA